MKKFCIILLGLIFLILNTMPAYGFLGSYLTKRKILSWNEDNAHNVQINLPTSSVFTTIKDYRQYNNVCFKKASLANNSDNTIRQIIIPFIVLSNNKEVYRENLLLNITAYPSATVDIDSCYELLGRSYDESELVAIKEQLGEAYGWRPDKIIIIPDSEEAPFESYDLEKILGIKIHRTYKR